MLRPLPTILLLLASCTTPPTEMHLQRIDGTTVTPATLDERIQQLVDTANVTGLAVLVLNHDTVAYRQAFGYANRETGDSLRTDQVFYGASLSKAVFGYLVASLVADGTLDLDRPLQDYLDQPIPEIQFSKEWRGWANLAGDDRYKQITARMCMNHTTGLPNWRWISRDGGFTSEGELYFYFDPGTSYSYSGEGMHLLQYVVEQLTGRGVEALARERLFDPVGMSMTSYVWQPRFEGQYCNGHTSDQQVLEKDTEDDASAAGSMETTPDDYGRFLAHLLKLSTQGSPITDLLFEPTIRIRSARQFGPRARDTTDANDGISLGYGLGWGVLSTPFGKGVFKEGHGEGFQHYSILFPEQSTGVLLMSNSDNAESIFKPLLELTIGDTFTPWEWEGYVPYDRVGDGD